MCYLSITYFPGVRQATTSFASIIHHHCCYPKLTNMSDSASDITTLLSNEMYNPEIIPQLEAYLDSQVQQDSSAPSNSYNFDANRTLIKLYQFFPQQAKTQYILLAESLALVYGEVSREGSNDFGALGCLITESVKNDEPYPTLVRCADLLDSCQFPEFWTVYHSVSTNSTDYEMVAKLSTSSHAKNALRKTILNKLSQAFKATKLSYVMQQLDLEIDSDEAKAFLKDSEGVVEKSDKSADSIVFCNNVENTKRDKVSQEGGIDYSMIRGFTTKANKIAVE